jgi:hypothetical protein
MVAWRETYKAGIVIATNQSRELVISHLEIGLDIWGSQATLFCGCYWMLLVIAEEKASRIDVSKGIGSCETGVSATTKLRGEPLNGHGVPIESGIDALDIE